MNSHNEQSMSHVHPAGARPAFVAGGSGGLEERPGVPVRAPHLVEPVEVVVQQVGVGQLLEFRGTEGVGAAPPPPFQRLPVGVRGGLRRDRRTEYRCQLADDRSGCRHHDPPSREAHAAMLGGGGDRTSRCDPGTGVARLLGDEAAATGPGASRTRPARADLVCRSAGQPVSRSAGGWGTSCAGEGWVFGGVGVVRLIRGAGGRRVGVTAVRAAPVPLPAGHVRPYPPARSGGGEAVPDLLERLRRWFSIWS